MTELGLISLFGLLPLAITAWGVLDAAMRPEWAFEQVGQNKLLWIILPAALYFVCLGWVAAIFYLVSIRPKVRAAQLGPGGPPPIDV